MARAFSFQQLHKYSRAAIKKDSMPHAGEDRLGSCMVFQGFPKGGAGWWLLWGPGGAYFLFLLGERRCKRRKAPKNACVDIPAFSDG